MRWQPAPTLVLMTAMAFSIRRIASSPRCVYRHILCHQSAQHAVDPCRDTTVADRPASASVPRASLRALSSACQKALFVVVGERETLGPVAAAAVGCAHDLRSGRMVAAVAERDTG
jgi:hypothetical protein